MQNLIQEIKEAEERAASIEREATLHAQDEIKKITEQHRKEMEDIMKNFSSLKKNAVKMAADDFDKISGELSNKANQQISEIISKASQNRKKAADFILKKILE